MGRLKTTLKPILATILSTTLLIAAIEAASLFYLKQRNISTPLFYDPSGKSLFSSNPLLAGNNCRGLDPHLGYGHSEQEERVKQLKKGYRWVDGFVVYSDINPPKHPVILTLGGSTTDGIWQDYSWPELLAILLKINGKEVTVINGGVAGYTSNQELLKLIRDGLEFYPDFVIAYDGINDRGFNSELPYPMVHSYQKDLLYQITNKYPENKPRTEQRPKILPSTLTALKFLSRKGNTEGPDPVFGTKTSRTLAEQYRKNVELMHAVVTSQGGQFDVFIQPFAFYNSRHSFSISPDVKGQMYIESTLDLYESITSLPAIHSYVHDATQILEGHDDVYKPDGVHLKEKGDKVVAQYIYNFIAPKLK